MPLELTCKVNPGTHLSNQHSQREGGKGIISGSRPTWAAEQNPLSVCL